MAIVQADDRTNVVDALNRIYWRDKGAANFGDTVIWHHTTADYILDVDNVSGNHANFGSGVLTITDSGVGLGADLSLNSGHKLVFWNAGNTNSADLYHSGTDDVLKTDDGLQVAVALNVGAAISATDAGDIYGSGGISVGTYSNPGAGEVLASGKGSFGGTLHATGDFDIATNKFTVTAASGNTSAAGTLHAGGNFDVGTTRFTVNATSGNTAILGDVAVNTNKFTISASTGNTSALGTLHSGGDFDVNTTAFTVTATSGNTSVGGTLHSAGNFDVGTTKFTVASASGNTVVGGTLGITGDVAVNTNKFTVAASSGNTLVAGTLSATGDFAVATSKFTVAAASGNTLAAGTLSSTGDFAVATNKFTVAASTGNTVVAGTLSATGDFKVATNKFTVTASSGDTLVAGDLTAANNLKLTGASGPRITGLLDGAAANRLMFQTSTANIFSLMSIIPSGTSTQSGWLAYNNSTPASGGFAWLYIVGSTAFVDTSVNTISLELACGGSTRIKINNTGLSFFGGTPVGQPASAAAATDLATVITLANSLRTGVRSLSLFS